MVATGDVNASVPFRTVPERNGWSCRSRTFQNRSALQCERFRFRNRSAHAPFARVWSRSVAAVLEMASGSWSDEETLKLITIWGKDAIQAMLEGCRRNKEVFAKIAAEMQTAGYNKSAEQCSGKIKMLKFEYLKIKDKHGKTGEGRKNWKFLEPLDEVLGHKPATRPPVVVESGSTEDQEVDLESVMGEAGPTKMDRRLPAALLLQQLIC